MEDTDHDRRTRDILNALGTERLRYFQLLLRILPKPTGAQPDEDLVHLALFSLIRALIEDGLIECTWKDAGVRVPDELWLGNRGKIWLQAFPQAEHRSA